MDRRFVNILGINISNLPVEEVVRGISDRVNLPGAFQIVTINPLIFDSALKAVELYKIIKRAYLVVADSIGIKILGWLYGCNIKRIPGIYLLERLLSLASADRLGVFLLGSTEKNIAKACENIKKLYPNLILKGFQNGYFNDCENDAVVEKISHAAPDFLFVGLPTPMQELWIGRNLDKLRVKAVMGVGGSFDVLSGNLKAAPKFMRLLGLEWLFRAVQEPSRFLRIIKIPFFLFKVLVQSIISSRS